MGFPRYKLSARMRHFNAGNISEMHITNTQQVLYNHVAKKSPLVPSIGECLLSLQPNRKTI